MKLKILSRLFCALALVLSHVMCAVVAYNYAALERCEMCSAPASVAFLLLIPYGIGIVICAGLALFFHKRNRCTEMNDK